MHKKKLIVVVGPTAVGKTAFSLQLADQYRTSIISADSRQCFKELNIGVAKPSSDELNRIRHYFIDSHSVQEGMNAAIFSDLASHWTAEIFSENDTAVMVGGTGLYIKAFCEGLDAVPGSDEKIRNEIKLQYKDKGIDWLQQEVREKDPEFFARGEIRNPQRMMRALEVILSTGKSILSFRNSLPVKHPFEIQKIGISLPAHQLRQNIDFRVDQMMERGLLEEVRRLLPNRNLNALQTVGYKELFGFLDDVFPLEVAVNKIKKNTWQYARRQLTWFRKDPSILWQEPGL